MILFNGLTQVGALCGPDHFTGQLDEIIEFFNIQNVIMFLVNGQRIARRRKDIFAQVIPDRF